MSGLARGLRKTDAAATIAVVRYLRAAGVQIGVLPTPVDPTKPSSDGTSGSKHAARLRQDGGL